MKKDENTQSSQETDAIVKLGEKYHPGWFSKKDKSSLIWSSAAVILGGVMVSLWAFAPSNHPLPSEIKTEPFKEILVTASPDSWPAVFEQKKDQIKVVKGFTTEIEGVKGWIVEEKDGGPATQSLMYTANNGELAIIGGIIGKNNTNVTMQHFEKFGSSEAARIKDAQKTEAKKAETASTPQEKSAIDLSLVQGILDTQPVVSFGTGTKKLTILVDPNCPYCHQYYFSLITDEEIQKQFQIDFMPVGILSMDSVRKAAMFDGLDAGSAKELLKKMMLEQAVAINPSEEHITSSMVRTQKWGDAGLNVVPMTIFNFDDPANSKAIPGVQSNASLKGITF